MYATAKRERERERETFVIIRYKFYENLCYYGSSSEVYVSYSDNQTKFIHCARELIVCLIKVEIKTETHHLICTSIQSILTTVKTQHKNMGNIPAIFA
jgi:hypothetical protein